MAEETPKSPENSGEAEPKKYVSKCLICGHPVHAEFDNHPSPVLPVTDEDIEMWRKCGDSEYVIEKRVLVRGKAA